MTVETQHIAKWLREARRHDAAALLTRAEHQLVWVDSMLELRGERDWDIYDVEILVPKEVLSAVSRNEEAVQAVEEAYRELAPSAGFGVRDVRWMPRIPDIIEAASPLDFENIDDSQIREFWRKALERVPGDPGGAVTAARSLLEAACKRILANRGISFNQSGHLPQLFDAVLFNLRLAPRQQASQLLKKVLGNAVSVVQGVAELRGKLGDAHGPGPDASLATIEQAELVVNLAGAVALYIFRVDSLGSSGESST